jgi:hydroxymethylpyrimidine/phosphomethylpyrimidine kinase
LELYRRIAVRPRVLSIGTTHPRGYAGVGRDLIVGTRLQCDVSIAIAAVSLQDENGVRAVYALPAATLRAQLDFLQHTGVVRIGALGSADNVAVVVAWLRARGDSVIAIVDPVMRASPGGTLADEATFGAIRATLATLPNVVLTPNLLEAAALLETSEIGDAAAAAALLRARGAKAVLLKGGHAVSDPADVLATAEGVESFVAPRIDVEMRGTGCTLAMALACGVAQRLPLRDAVLMAREYVRAELMETLQR